MAECVLTARSGLEHLAVPGRRGAAAGEAGVSMTVRSDVALASVLARKGRGEALAARGRAAFGIELPATPKRAAIGPIGFAWAGPGHWLASCEGVSGAAFEASLRQELAGLVSVADQSDGRVLIRVGGPRARAALAKGVMIDLDPRAFAPGDAAVTSIAHVGAHFWQLDAAATYEFAVFRSYSAAFWEGLVEAAAEFGVAVV